MQGGGQTEKYAISPPTAQKKVKNTNESVDSKIFFFQLHKHVAEICRAYQIIGKALLRGIY